MVKSHIFILNHHVLYTFLKLTFDNRGRTFPKIFMKILVTVNSSDCDKLATELKLTTLRVESRQFSATATAFWPTPHAFGARLSFVEIFGIRIQKARVSGRCLRDPTFSRFSRTPTCDRQTDGQTNTWRRLAEGPWTLWPCTVAAMSAMAAVYLFTVAWSCSTTDSILENLFIIAT